MLFLTNQIINIAAQAVMRYMPSKGHTGAPMRWIKSLDCYEGLAILID
jgi:hypothetical protein